MHAGSWEQVAQVFETVEGIPTLFTRAKLLEVELVPRLPEPFKLCSLISPQSPSIAPRCGVRLGESGPTTVVHVRMHIIQYYLHIVWVLKALFLIYLDRNLFLEGASVALDSRCGGNGFYYGWMDGRCWLGLDTRRRRKPRPSNVNDSHREREEINDRRLKSVSRWARRCEKRKLPR